MESPTHNLPSLFKQLGLPDDAESIDKFIATHSPLKPELHLADAFFWSPSQAERKNTEPPTITLTTARAKVIPAKRR